MTGERIERKKNSRGGAKGGERIMHPSEIDSRDRKKNRQAEALRTIKRYRLFMKIMQIHRTAILSRLIPARGSERIIDEEGGRGRGFVYFALVFLSPAE